MTNLGQELPAIGSYVTVRFGDRATQTARVEHVTKAGNIQIRAFNASRSRWYPSRRTVTLAEILATAPAGTPRISPADELPPNKRNSARLVQ